MTESSPAVAAAVEQERRMGAIEAELRALRTAFEASSNNQRDALASILARLDLQNGRVARREQEHEELRDLFNSHVQEGRDRQLWPRIERLEGDMISARANANRIDDMHRTLTARVLPALQTIEGLVNSHLSEHGRDGAVNTYRGKLLMATIDNAKWLLGGGIGLALLKLMGG